MLTIVQPWGDRHGSAETLRPVAGNHLRGIFSSGTERSRPGTTGIWSTLIFAVGGEASRREGTDDAIDGIDRGRGRGDGGITLHRPCTRGAAYSSGAGRRMGSDGGGYALLAQSRRASLRAPVWLPKQISGVQYPRGLPSGLKSLVARNGSTGPRWSGTPISNPGPPYDAAELLGRYHGP